MSARSARRVRALFALVALLLSGTLGCWEQWSNDWFPQMKWQPAVQAFESVAYQGRVAPFLPPEGSVPIHGGEAPIPPDDEPAADALVNPQPMSLESLENGRQQFATFCSACHGSGGLGDGSVSMTGEIQGPLGGVLALAGPASIARVRSDGHIYTTIRHGRRRMPSYHRIPSPDRWDIVNYIRYLNGQKGVAR